MDEQFNRQEEFDEIKRKLFITLTDGDRLSPIQLAEKLNDLCQACSPPMEGEERLYYTTMSCLDLQKKLVKRLEELE